VVCQPEIVELDSLGTANATAFRSTGGLSMAQAFAVAGAKLTILSRSVPKASGSWSHRVWSGRTLGDWVEALEGVDAVVNLAGRTVNCIKTPDHQDEILRSRVESTLVLGDAMRSVESPPPVWIQMSNVSDV
jgi:NAD dependent epimerase/dehydratase family enzyme